MPDSVVASLKVKWKEKSSAVTLHYSCMTSGNLGVSGDGDRVTYLCKVLSIGVRWKFTARVTILIILPVKT